MDNDDIKRQIQTIKGCIVECDEKIESYKKAKDKLIDDLQYICFHPEDDVVETVYRVLLGEEQYYQPDLYEYNRVCTICGLKEYVQTNSLGDAKFIKLPSTKNIRNYV